MIRHVFLVTVYLLLLPSSLLANDDDIGKLYLSAGIQGTLLIESLNSDIQYTNDLASAEQAHIPASTFKVANTLIALEEGLIKGPFDIIEWDNFGIVFHNMKEIL